MSPAGRAVFVTGTDTGVGKTYVACGLARAWRAAGVDVGAVKPFASGAVKRGGRWTHDDVEALVRASGTTDSAEEVCPCLLRDPLAPSVAAAREGRRLDPARVARRVRRVIGRHARTVVEGAGGLLVPVTPRETMAEFAKRLGVPLLIVAPSAAAKGGVSHAADGGGGAGARAGGAGGGVQRDGAGASRACGAHQSARARAACRGPAPGVDPVGCGDEGIRPAGGTGGIRDLTAAGDRGIEEFSMRIPIFRCRIPP